MMKNTIITKYFRLFTFIFLIVLFPTMSCQLAGNEGNYTDQSIEQSNQAEPNEKEENTESSTSESGEENTTQSNELNSSQVNVTQNNPLESNTDDSGELIPVFKFYGDTQYIIDYEMRSYSTRRGAYSINKNYEVDYGNPIVQDLLSGEIVGQIELSNCNHPEYNFLVGNYLITKCSFDCPPDRSNIQAWNLLNNSYVGEIHVGWDEYCSNYVFLAQDPYDKLFLLSGPTGYARLFSINPFQELSINADDRLAGEIVSSPDKNYVVSGGRMIWQWTNTGVKFIYGLQDSGSNYLSVSANAEFAVYRDYGKSLEHEMVVFDRVNNNEVLRVYEDDLMYGGFDIEYSALSHDGEYLFLSGNNNDEYYVIVMKTRTGEILHNFGPFGNLVPWRLRIEYLPESIRNIWTWVNY